MVIAITGTTLMTQHGRLLFRTFLLSMAAAVLIAGHGFVLYYVSSHLALSAAAISGLIILLVIKHLGLLSPLHAALRRRSRRGAR
jgi:hypothetical protein